MYGKCLKDEPRSIIVIDSPGCSWGKCKFCAVYKQTADDDAALNQLLKGLLALPNDETKLQIVSSASFSDYSIVVQDAIFEVIKNTNIKLLILEQRWGLHRHIPIITERYNEIGVNVEWIIGLESLFDRHRYNLGKEPYEADLEYMSKYFMRANLLYGYKSKPFSVLRYEVVELLKWFKVISINMYENAEGSDLKRDTYRVEEFYNSKEFKRWLVDPKIHILDCDPRAQTDFGGIDTFVREH